MVHPGVLYSDISDHLPIFCLIGKRKYPKKLSEPRIFKYRSISEISIRHITSALQEIDWTYLHQLNINNAFKEFMTQLHNAVDSFAPEKNTKIKSKHVIRNEWMTKGLMKSSTKSNKLYRKCIGESRTHSTYVRYITYSHLYKQLKHIAKTTYYANLLQKFKIDSKKTWQVLRTLIGKHNDKSCIPTHFKFNAGLINDPDQISNTFCNFFTNVRPSYANAIPKPQTHFNAYLNKSP